MASTFSPSLRIELIGDGDQSGIWGQTTNNNLGTLLEQSIAGVVTITMLDANYTLTNFNGVSDEARNQVIVATGTNAAQRDIIAPLVEKTYTIKNSTTGGFAVRIIGASGTGVIVPNGTTASVYCDGTNFYALNTGTTGNYTVTGNLSVTGTTSLTGALNASTATFSGAISSVSPAFTGTPTAPTAVAGTNTTQIATTAFVLANGVPSGAILMWSGSIASIPSGWLLCNGSSGTPDLRDRFVVGAGSTYAVAATGGSKDAIVVAHTHSLSASGTTSTESNGHTHTFSGTTSAMSANANHSHGVADPGHSHSLPNVFYQSFPNAFTGGGGAGQTITSTGTAATGISINSANVDHTHTYSGTTSDISANHTHTVTVTGTSGSTGSSGTNANLPPYYALAYIMKA